MNIMLLNKAQAEYSQVWPCLESPQLSFCCRGDNGLEGCGDVEEAATALSHCILCSKM